MRHLLLPALLLVSLQALAVQPVCLSCHGLRESLSPEVTGKLHSLYPSDQGVGYSLGQIRGAMTIRKAL